MNENKVGKPPAFKSKEELQNKIDKYFKDCREHTSREYDEKSKNYIEIENPLIPTIAGLAYALGVDRQTIYNYSYKEEYFDTINNARMYIISQIESKLANVNGNIGGTIFLAKNYGYKDTQEIDNKGSITIVEIPERK